MGLKNLLTIFGPRIDGVSALQPKDVTDLREVALGEAIAKRNGRLDDKQLTRVSEALSRLRAKGVTIEGEREG